MQRFVSLTSKIRFIESVFGASKLSRDNLNIDVWCPICAPFDKSKKKLVIRTDDDRNHCWTCGWRAHTLSPLLKKFADREKIIEYRDNFAPIAQFANLSTISHELQQQLTLPQDFRLLVMTSSQPESQDAIQYLKTRNISERDMWKFKLGISDEYRWRRRIIAPSFDSEGKLNYFIARALDTHRRPKYDNPDYDKTRIIFNELHINWSRRLTICEGIFDLFKCGDNAVPLMGSDLNEQSVLFNTIITNETSIALALDADMWNTKTLRMAKKLSEYKVDVKIVDTRPFVDPGNTTKTIFKEAYKLAKQFNWESTFKTKLAKATKTM